MSSNGAVAVIAGVCLLVGTAGGYVLNGIRTKSAMDALVRENNDLRKKLAALAEVFKNSSSSMVAAVAEVVSNPPRTVAQLECQLNRHDLTPTQIAQILDEVKRLGILKAA